MDLTGTRQLVTWGSHTSVAAYLTVLECYTVSMFQGKEVLPSSWSNDPRWVLLFVADEGSTVLREVGRTHHSGVLELIWRVRFVMRLCFFSGAVAKLRKATISFVMSVRPSVRLSSWNNSAPTGRIFMKFDIELLFEKSVKQIDLSLKSDKNKGYRTWRHVYVSDSFSLNYS